MGRPIKRIKPPLHYLVVDTNILWHGDKAEVVAPEFRTFWEQYGTEFEIELVVPSVVRGELLFQQTTSAVKMLAIATDKLKRVGAIADKEYRLGTDPARVRRDVETRFDASLRGVRAHVEPTPVKTIDWNALIEKAVWREAPFEENKKDRSAEKGFRDALILETVVSLSKLELEGAKLAFCTADELLRTTAEKAVSAVDDAAVYDRLESFSSYLRLTKEKLDHAFVKAIQARAARKFYKGPGDSAGLIYSSLVIERIRREFEGDFEPIEEAHPSATQPLRVAPKSGWEPIASEGRWLRPSIFVRLEGQHEFYWSNRLVFERLYEFTSLRRGFLAALDPAKGETRLLSVAFDVEWKAKVWSDGRFRDLDVCEVRKVERSFDLASEKDLARHSVEGQAR